MLNFETYPLNMQGGLSLIATAWEILSTHGFSVNFGVAVAFIPFSYILIGLLVMDLGITALHLFLEWGAY